MKKPVISILSALTGVAFGAGAIGKVTGKKISKTKSMSNKHLSLFLMMNQWVKVKQQGKNLASYFEKYGYKEIAVYGMSYAGETLIDELAGSSIKVKYGIDKNAGAIIYSDLDIVTMESDLAEVDAIVVTAITFFDEIEEQLADKIDCPILSLEDVLYDV